MKLRLQDFLVCPISKSPLELLSWEEKQNVLNLHSLNKINEMGLNRNSFETEIINGVLLNTKEKIYYPIYNGVPRMLTYQCGVFIDFYKKFQTKIANELSDYFLPLLPPPIGEESVIRSFSKEWLEYNWNPEKYWKIDSEYMYRSMRFMLNLENIPIKNKQVLEVGIGIGGIANSISSKESCELIGIDLSYAVDAAYKNFQSNLFFHIVQASAFRLPFKENTFDYVYSQGVLHHSSDPKQCFVNVSKLPKKGGYLYVWFYSDTSEKRNFLRKSIMILEKSLRPIIWPLPQFLQNIFLAPLAALYIFHQNIIETRKDKELIKYSFREALHAARDRFTPRYAFRYSEEEVARWYNSVDFNNLIFLSKKPTEDYFIKELNRATAIIGQKK